MASILTEGAFNAFYTGITRQEKGVGTTTPTEMNSKLLFGKLSRLGANADFTGNADFSSTGNMFSFLTTAPCTIHKLMLSLSLTSFANTVVAPSTVFLGGGAALTNGIKMGVGLASATTTVPTILVSGAAKTIEQFSTVWGGNVSRNSRLESATAGQNWDSVIVTVNFKEAFGCPLLLDTGVLMGVFLNDNLSAVVTSLTGAVIGRLT
jgi:hypothetical protein